MAVVPVLSMQNTAVNGSAYEDLEALRKKLNMTFWVATFTKKDDLSFDAKFENYDLEPCEYSTYFTD
jgi:hypothetical protein